MYVRPLRVEGTSTTALSVSTRRAAGLKPRDRPVTCRDDLGLLEAFTGSGKWN
jgi:hypothetical protein